MGTGAWTKPLVDLFGRNLANVGGALLEAVIDISLREHLVRVDALCVPDRDLRPILEHAGFRRREFCREVAYEGKGQGARLLNSDLRWTFTNFEVMY